MPLHVCLLAGLAPPCGTVVPLVHTVLFKRPSPPVGSRKPAIRSPPRSSASPLNPCTASADHGGGRPRRRRRPWLASLHKPTARRTLSYGLPPLPAYKLSNVTYFSVVVDILRAYTIPPIGSYDRPFYQTVRPAVRQPPLAFTQFVWALPAPPPVKSCGLESVFIPDEKLIAISKTQSEFVQVPIYMYIQLT